jgi:L-lactate dehydrogenase (cytochrome)
VLSNHGGRSLDTSPPSIMILLECQRRYPEIFERLEVYVDGGIRRGTDILKCLCLGAKAVGLGRPFLYSVNYGAEGVDHMVDSKSRPPDTTLKDNADKYRQSSKTS